MDSYYSESLSAQRLKHCYDLAPESVQRYLSAETEYVRKRIRPGDRVLELGCGYGRVVKELAATASLLVGVDTSLDSLCYAQEYLGGLKNTAFIQMNAISLAFHPNAFDLVFCIQNGISAFHVDKRTLLRSAVGAVGSGGKVLFSSYAEQFWEHRLSWFRIQAAHGLVGEIDEAATGNGVIVCRDGFTATIVHPDEFLALATGLGASASIEVVADSSIFCEIIA